MLVNLEGIIYLFVCLFHLFISLFKSNIGPVYKIYKDWYLLGTGSYNPLSLLVFFAMFQCYGIDLLFIALQVSHIC